MNAVAIKEAAFMSLPISFWNEAVGAPMIITLEGIWDDAALPLDSDIWIDVSYLGTSGFPLALFATSCSLADNLAAGVEYPASVATWNGSVTPFAMSATITPQEKGPVTIYVRVAKASSTFYIDPRPVVT